MSSSSEFSPFAAFLTVGGERPDASLLQSLPEEVLARARGFQSLKRQTEFLWGRLIFYAVFRALAPQVVLVERPPLTPQILMPDGSERIFASIAHTAGCIDSWTNFENHVTYSDFSVGEVANPDNAFQSHVRV